MNSVTQLHKEWCIIRCGHSDESPVWQWYVFFCDGSTESIVAESPSRIEAIALAREWHCPIFCDHPAQPLPNRKTSERTP